MPKAKRTKDGRWKKITYNEVKACFEEQGCVLLSKEYKNARTHLDYVCSCGDQSRIIYDSFRRGHKCRKCGGKKVAASQTLTYEFVKETIAQSECKLLSDTYVAAISDLKIQCRCGKVFYRCWNDFQRTSRVCSKCALRNRSGENHYEWKKDRKQYEEDYTFRQKLYKMLKHALTHTGKEKTDHSMNMLGYTHLQLRDYIKSHKNWDKVKNEQWHLDHIFPMKAFIDFNIRDIKLINCLDNLQPLLAAENISKNSKYDIDEFKMWLLEKGIVV